MPHWTTTGTVPLRITTAAVSLLVGSTTPIALTVSTAPLAAVAGAVYRPAASIVPPAPPTSTCQVTRSCASPFTSAVNWNVRPTETSADGGETSTPSRTFTVTSMGGAEPSRAVTLMVSTAPAVAAAGAV